MSVTAASFRSSYPAFASLSAYPDPVITFWLAIAALILNVNASGAPTICSFAGSVALGGELTVSAITFGSLQLAQGPLLLAGPTVPAKADITEQFTGPQGGPGLYQISVTNYQVANGPLVAVQGNFSATANTRWGVSSPTPDVPPTAIADFAIGLYVAHNLTLEKQALDQAARGGAPTGVSGILSSKSVGQVSASYDISSATEEGAGWYNLTIYGRRLFQLAMAKGAGPYQIGIGVAPPLSGGAWPGPWPFPQQGGVGFGG